MSGHHWSSRISFLHALHVHIGSLNVSTCQLVLVIGAPNSSNSVRLVEVAERCGAQARLVQRGDEIQADWLDGVEVLGLTAGASAPEALIQEVIARIGEFRAVAVEQVITAEEKVVFKLPRQLTD